MKRFKVKYKIIQEREFWVPDESFIKSILNEQNLVEIINIEELPFEV